MDRPKITPYTCEQVGIRGRCKHPGNYVRCEGRRGSASNILLRHLVRYSDTRGIKDGRPLAGKFDSVLRTGRALRIPQLVDLQIEHRPLAVTDRADFGKRREYTKESLCDDFRISVRCARGKDCTPKIE